MEGTRIGARDFPWVVAEQSRLQHGLVGQALKVGVKDADLAQACFDPRHLGHLLRRNNECFRTRFLAAARMGTTIPASSAYSRLA